MRVAVLKIRRADARVGGGYTLTTYHVLRLDRVQAHAYVVQEVGIDHEKRVDLLPAKYRTENAVLQARGEWQLPSMVGLMYPMALLLRGRGYSLAVRS